jgi:hypothetical protein
VRVYLVTPTSAFRGLAGLGYTSPNGVPGTIQPNGYVRYSGAVLGLPSDVEGNVGDPVYGPLYPPPGVPVTAPILTTNPPAPPAAPPAPPAAPAAPTNTTPAYNPAAAATCPAGSTTRTTPAAGDKVLSQLPGGAYCVQPAAAPAPAQQPQPAAPVDPNAGAQVIGNATGATFNFQQAAADLLTKAETIAPWYVWAGGGAAALLLLFSMHSKGRKRR